MPLKTSCRAELSRRAGLRCGYIIYRAKYGGGRPGGMDGGNRMRDWIVEFIPFLTFHTYHFDIEYPS
jgi:hypothetical protein